MVHVIFDGAQLNSELCSDLSIGETKRNQADYTLSPEQ